MVRSILLWFVLAIVLVGAACTPPSDGAAAARRPRRPGRSEGAPQPTSGPTGTDRALGLAGPVVVGSRRPLVAFPSRWPRNAKVTSLVTGRGTPREPTRSEDVTRVGPATWAASSAG